MAMGIGMQAQEKKSVFSDTKLSGYIVTQYQATCRKKRRATPST